MRLEFLGRNPIPFPGPLPVHSKRQSNCVSTRLESAARDQISSSRGSSRLASVDQNSTTALQAFLPIGHQHDKNRQSSQNHGVSTCDSDES